MIDGKALLAWLARKAREAPVGDAPMLVQHAIYEGLAERIKSGEFDYVVVEDDDICGDYPAPCNHDPAHERKDADSGTR